MKKVIRKKVFYCCDCCGTEYANKAEALLCEKMTIEVKVFGVGDQVRGIEPRFCQMKQKQYFFSGAVVKIIGPEPSDYEYEAKWLGGKKDRLNSHIFRYQVRFSCPHCEEIREERYCAPELRFADRR